MANIMIMTINASKDFHTLCSRKSSNDADPIVMVTAYDAPTMRYADKAQADIVLVGDSAAMVMLGYESTISMTQEEMEMLVRAVCRVNEKLPVVVDMVWGSYHVSPEQAVSNAIKLIHAGANAVKVEGGVERVDTIRALVAAQIPVVAHVGLTPQSILELGSYNVQGKEFSKAQKVLEDSRAVANAGASMLVIECVPDALSRTITEELSIPVIGIGAGRHVDGQVLVIHDILGIGDSKKPKFVREYENIEEKAVKALKNYCDDVRNKTFPSSEETYHMADDVVSELQKLDKNTANDASSRENSEKHPA
ncbi:MAG: 3-methyl-2-oxobutanoate hydroxymethyltransferase [Acidimicrobiia bacterium]